MDLYVYVSPKMSVLDNIFTDILLHLRVGAYVSPTVPVLDNIFTDFCYI